jgi:hypothetical protein
MFAGTRVAAKPALPPLPTDFTSHRSARLYTLIAGTDPRQLEFAFALRTQVRERS